MNRHYPFLQNIHYETDYILYEISCIAKKLNTKVYIAGGLIRDHILKFTNNDIDLLIDTDTETFAKEISTRFNGKLKLYPQFLTAYIKLGKKYNLIKHIDIARARTEIYKSYGSFPTVKAASIKEDLKRRDFTINSMVLDLSYQKSPKILDFFEGKKDIKNQLIRVLHPNSFLDDPTRIFRAIKFAARYNFKIEKNTEQWLIDALEKNIFQFLSKERIEKELILISKEKNVQICYDILNKYEILKNIPMVDELKKYKNNSTK